MKQGGQSKSILAIESAVADGSVAIIQEGQPVVIHSGDGASRAERILSVIESVLEKAGLAPAEIDLIAVSIGPGSYSGIRIGMSTALGLRDSLGVKCVGVPTLIAMSHAATTDEAVTCAVPVGKSDVAWQLFGPRKADQRQALSGPQIRSVSNFVSEITRDDNTVLFAHSEVLTRIESGARDGIRYLDAGTGLAELVGRSATRLADGELVMRPMYLRNQAASV